VHRSYFSLYRMAKEAPKLTPIRARTTPSSLRGWRRTLSWPRRCACR
jgi:hypothetical protein